MLGCIPEVPLESRILPGFSSQVCRTLPRLQATMKEKEGNLFK